MQEKKSMMVVQCELKIPSLNSLASLGEPRDAEHLPS